MAKKKRGEKANLKSAIRSLEDVHTTVNAVFRWKLLMAAVRRNESEEERIVASDSLTMT